MGVWSDGEGVVRLPDGRKVRGTAAGRRRGRVAEPDFCLYLLGRRPGSTEWPSRWVHWRDFGPPESTDDALDALREAHARAGHERVEIACSGGVGRTGTAIAVLAVLSGVAANDAVDWVRVNYQPRAVETRRQRSWIMAAAERL